MIQGVENRRIFPVKNFQPKKKYFFAIIIPVLVLVGLIVYSFLPDSQGLPTLFTVSSSEQAAVSPEVSTPEPTATPEPTPTPEPTEPPFEEYDISLMALGDNLMHMGIVNTGKLSDGTYDYSFLFQNIIDFLDTADIRVINQETILGGNELGFSGYPRFNSPTEVGDAIAAAGFNVVLHATNHAADQGVKGIRSCVAYWNEKHPEILMTGIYDRENVPAEDIPLLTVGDVTFAVLNYTYGPNAQTIPSDLREHLSMLCAYNEKNGLIDFTTLNPKVLEDIQKADELADIVIVFPHWGTEYQSKPSSYQKKFAEEMTQAGADLIIGTHPHVPQPIEEIVSENANTSLCYYSLGNYVSTQKQTLSMLEGMAWVTFHVTEDGVSLNREASGVLPLVCHYVSGPVRLENVYLLEDYTEELAAQHGIRSYGGVTLRLSDLQTRCAEIFGDWVLTRSDILGSN